MWDPRGAQPAVGGGSIKGVYLPKILVWAAEAGLLYAYMMHGDMYIYLSAQTWLQYGALLAEAITQNYDCVQ